MNTWCSAIEVRRHLPTGDVPRPWKLKGFGRLHDKSKVACFEAMYSELLSRQQFGALKLEVRLVVLATSLRCNTIQHYENGLVQVFAIWWFNCRSWNALSVMLYHNHIVVGESDIDVRTLRTLKVRANFYRPLRQVHVRHQGCSRRLSHQSIRHFTISNTRSGAVTLLSFTPAFACAQTSIIL